MGYLLNPPILAYDGGTSILESYKSLHYILNNPF